MKHLFRKNLHNLQQNILAESLKLYSRFPHRFSYRQPENRRIRCLPGGNKNVTHT